jgi:hypothetical protein
MLGLNGLPLPYHPVFNIDEFLNHAQKDKFFLVIESKDPRFNLDSSKKFLSSLSPANVWEVPN